HHHPIYTLFPYTTLFRSVLVGHDGWADARYGDFDHSLVNLNDSRLIAELYQAFLLNKSALKREMQKLADTDASALQETLLEAIEDRKSTRLNSSHSQISY